MEYMALGCMSGTSLDGIDCSLIKSDGLSFANEISNEFIPYSKELQKKLLNTISQEYLNDTSVLTLLNEEYKKAINQFIKNNNVKIDLIAMHGQTIFHDQKTKISIQLFDKSLSFDSNSPVICNFRKNDLLNGGNGAPIMPEFHKMIAMQLDLKKVIFVNIGGVTNITLINNEDINAGDSSFGNAIINDLIFERIGQNFDINGSLSEKGKNIETLFNKILTDKFFDKKLPKSLDRNYFHKYNTSLNGLMIHHDIPPREFLDYVHDINLDFLEKAVLTLSNRRGINIIGPLPSLISKSKGNYRHHIYIQSSKKTFLNKVLKFLTVEFDKWPESKKVKWAFDIDPIDIN